MSDFVEKGFDVTAQLQLEFHSLKVYSQKYVEGLTKGLEAKVKEIFAKLPPIDSEEIEKIIIERTKIEVQREIERVVSVAAQARAREIVKKLPQHKELWPGL